MLLGLKNLSLNIGRTVLFDRINCTIERGERLCLVGRNGTGKSTLLKVITGEVAADSGEIQRSQGIKIAQLPQDVPRDISGDVYDVVAEGLGEAGRLVAEYHHLLHHEPDTNKEAWLNKLGRLQDALEAQNGWVLESRIEATLSRLQLTGDAEFASLSGGLKRRVLLARALVAEPDLLLLDEPTNHLDIASITWLEEFLLGWNGTLLFITHDRSFLRRLATRIIELDRGLLSSWPGNYEAYLTHKAEALHAEAKQNALFDKKLAAEEVWVRRGLEAQRVRDQGRVRRLKEMREQYGQRRNLPGQAKLVLQEAERSGKLVAEAKNISFAHGAQSLIRNLSTTVLRGDKIGIIGPNGAGKTTLINLLLGRLSPVSGEVRQGSKLEIAYFDQLRAKLDEERPVLENIGDGREFVEINGVRKHVISYLQEFLFSADRARSPVKALSGGERSRLLLAQLFSRPSNLIVLDEPTNDLDAETLDLLESLLLDYAGTVLLVSHDREFLNNVVGRCLVFEGNGEIGDYVGGYDDWLRQRSESAPVPAERIAAAAPVTRPLPAVPPAALNSKEKRELDELPKQIERLEAEQTELGALLSSGDLYQQAPEEAQKAQKRLSEIESELAATYARWEALEARR